MTTHAPETRRLDLPEEVSLDRAPGDDRAARDAAYRALVERLSAQSVTKRFEAYVDVPWDDPAYAIDPADPRFELPVEDGLGATDWYRGLPQPVRARFGLHLIASFMRIGLQFENVLQRGLLEFALELPNGAPEFRYAYHETIEEAHHTLMFQEFVNRSGIDVPGLPPLMRYGARKVVAFGRRFPELFFVFVLGGEDPIDHFQREMLRSGEVRHPLVERISRIHIIEEARHLSFARAYLRRHVPDLPAPRLLLLRVRTPLILGQMARLMMEPSPAMIAEYGIPRDVIQRVYRRNPAHRRRAADALRKVRELCVELGIAAPPFDRLWRRMGIWTDAAEGTDA